MSATVIAFPAVRPPGAEPAATASPALHCAPAKRSGRRIAKRAAQSPKAPARFTLAARNALNSISYTLPRWRVEYVARDSGGEFATITEILGSDAPLWRRDTNGPVFIICTNADGRLVVRDSDFVALETFGGPSVLVAALRRWL